MCSTTRFEPTVKRIIDGGAAGGATGAGGGAAGRETLNLNFFGTVGADGAGRGVKSSSSAIVCACAASQTRRGKISGKHGGSLPNLAPRHASAGALGRV